MVTRGRRNPFIEIKGSSQNLSINDYKEVLHINKRKTKKNTILKRPSDKLSWTRAGGQPPMSTKRGVTEQHTCLHHKWRNPSRTEGSLNKMETKNGGSTSTSS
jgi:hypothetical protein